MSSEDLKRGWRARMLEVALFVIAYLVLVNVVLPRFGIKGG
jgi:predicted nucleic acid-binding Zn ribbon protein